MTLEDKQHLRMLINNLDNNSNNILEIIEDFNLEDEKEEYYNLLESLEDLQEKISDLQENVFWNVWDKQKNK
jgi:hypothetical protein